MSSTKTNAESFHSLCNANSMAAVLMVAGVKQEAQRIIDHHKAHGNPPEDWSPWLNWEAAVDAANHILLEFS